MGWSARLSWNFPPPFFPPFRFVRVHGLVDEFRHVSIRPPHLVRCFPSASLCFLVRLFVSRVHVLWFPARTHERNGSYFVSFFVFFFEGFVPSSYGVSPLPPLEEIPFVFPFRFSFWRGKTERKSKGKRRGTSRGTPPRGEGTTRATGGILIVRGRVRGVFPTFVRGGTVPGVYTYPLPRAPSGIDRRGTRRRSPQDVVRVPPCGGSQLDRNVSPFLSWEDFCDWVNRDFGATREFFLCPGPIELHQNGFRTYANCRIWGGLLAVSSIKPYD